MRGRPTGSEDVWRTDRRGAVGERAPTVAVLPWGDRFETFHDKIGVSLDTFRNELHGGWLFAYVDALGRAGVRSLLLFASDKVDRPVRFTHRATGALVSVVPTPWLHLKVRNAQLRFRSRSKNLAAMATYVATPLRAVAHELRRVHTSVILCQEYEYPRFDVGVALGWLLHLPVFATYQGGNETISWIERPVRRLAVRSCAGLIIGATDEIERVQDRYGLPVERIAQIPNPVDVGSWRSVDRSVGRAELGIARNIRVVVWHGYMEEQRKGLDVLLDAWDVVCARRPHDGLRLLLVGTGRNTTGIRRRVEATERIQWVDRFVLDRRQLRRYLAASDVYVLSSRHEGFAVAPLEAMACGLPVVVTGVSGVSDLLPGHEADGGVIVPREDPQALAAALLRLLDDEALAQSLGARARRRVEQGFSLEVVGTRLRRFLLEHDRTGEQA
jgi:glycosyltransferase involved in cell wall biosynthesis